LIQDNWGKYFYIKDNETGEVWSPTWNIVKTPLDNYEVRYGFGYAVFSTEYKGVKIILTLFVPMNETIEVWDFKIENSRGKKVDLSIFSYFEWCLGSSADFHREFHKTFIETEFDENANAMIGTKGCGKFLLATVDIGILNITTSDSSLPIKKLLIMKAIKKLHWPE